MIKEFLNVKGHTKTIIKSKLYLEVELNDEMALQKPMVEMDIHNGRLMDMWLLDGENEDSRHELSEINKQQTIEYLSQIPHDEIENALFG